LLQKLPSVKKVQAQQNAFSQFLDAQKLLNVTSENKPAWITETYLLNKVIVAST